MAAVGQKRWFQWLLSTHHLLFKIQDRVSFSPCPMSLAEQEGMGSLWTPCFPPSYQNHPVNLVPREKPGLYWQREGEQGEGGDGDGQGKGRFIIGRVKQLRPSPPPPHQTIPAQ